MVGQVLSHYKVLEEISRGGMGIVYRAVDTKLDREVALKVLPPELVADPERKRRFIQEAKAAAKLDHPHIAAIHEIDEADGVTFIAMELIEGEKLGDVIRREHPSTARALELATEVAEGLGRAHDKGIAHRDLKPSNIMVTEEGHAKIIDFGLVKLVEPLEERGSEAETALRGETDSGKVMGTVSYMSPEQARGQKVDHRTDIFSFGIVLFEMLTEEPPFKAPSGPETLTAIITARTPSLGSAVAGDVAPEIERIVEKCLAKDRTERYQGMKDLIVDLRAVRRRLESGAVAPMGSPSHRKTWYFAAGFAVAILLLAGIYFLYQTPHPEEIPVAPTKPSVAVLYFENASGDPELDWLRTGLTDMLVTDLSQSPNLRVISTDSLYQILSDMNRLDERITSLELVQDVAERTGSRTVVLGSFMKAGETIRINIRIQDATRGEILSTERVEGVGTDQIFPMVDDLSRRIRLRLDDSSLAEDLDLKDVTTTSMEAYRFYTEARKLELRFMYANAVPLLEKAVELDPQFAMALIRLSASHISMGNYNEARKWADQAMEYAGRLPPHERYYIEGLYYYQNLETVDRSITAFRKLLEIDPNHGSARHILGALYGELERNDECIEQLDLLRHREYP